MVPALIWVAGTLASHAQGAENTFGRNAGRWEARGGILSYETGALTPHYTDDVVFNGELLAPSPGFLAGIGAPRPYIGFNIAAGSDSVSFGYAGLNWDAYFTENVYASFSLGGAIHNAGNLTTPPVSEPALGCRTLFHLGLALGYDITPNYTVQLYADHVSNANLCGVNDGLESAGVRAGMRF